jgi:2-polyprenyl-3-methyl-5-hydroxy-6-metoxy-1,4-benzoquinol methylase
MLETAKSRLKALLSKIRTTMKDDRPNKNEQELARSYWDSNPSSTSVSTMWTNNSVIGEAIYRRMSGGESAKHWLNWLLEDHFRGQKFKHVLSPGCGTGAHEIIVARSGMVEVIDAFDFSEASLKIAKDDAKNAGVHINFYQDDLNSFVLDNRKYDLVICSGSLHHTREIEHFLSTIRDALKPGGYFIVNEYVGDCYNIYHPRKVELLDRLYRCFPKSLRSGQSERFRNITIDERMATDATESVRSALILPLLREYFDLEVCHPFGGQLLHPLYGLLDHNQLEQRDPKTETILRLLLEFEATLMEMPGGLETDFCFCICRPK